MSSISVYTSLALQTNNGTYNLTNSIFQNLTGGTEGGAIFSSTTMNGVNYDYNSIIIWNCSFKSSTSSISGGGMSLENVVVNVI